MDLYEADQASIARVRANVLRTVGAEQAVARRQRVWRVAATSGVLVAVLGLTGGAIAVVRASQAEIDGSIRCFAAAAVNAEFTTVIEARVEGGSANPAFAERALEVCAAVWRVGLIGDGEVKIPADPSQVDHPVPQLIACNLRDGVVGVFPSDNAASEQCLALGLTPVA